MKAHPVLMAIIGWLIGSFFGLGQLLGMFQGARVKPAMA